MDDLRKIRVAYSAIRERRHACKLYYEKFKRENHNSKITHHERGEFDGLSYAMKIIEMTFGLNQDSMVIDPESIDKKD
jgi:hypothetical protein